MSKSILPAALAIGAVLQGLVLAPPARADEHWPERPLSTIEPVAQPRNGELSEAEMAMARNAWRYFEVNWQPDTGFTNAVNAYPSTTLWDTGSYIAAVISAEGLGLIDEAQARDRLDPLLGTLERLQLFRTNVPGARRRDRWACLFGRCHDLCSLTGLRGPFRNGPVE